MTKQELGIDLENCGFRAIGRQEYGYSPDRPETYEIQLENKICIQMDSFFGKVNRLSFYFWFKQNLDEELHDDFWDKCESMISDQDLDVTLAALCCEFVELDFEDKRILNKISGTQVRNMCSEFLACLKPIFDEFFV